MERALVAMCNADSPEETYSVVRDKLKSNGQDPILIIYFSDCDNFYNYTNFIHADFPNSRSIGSTTYLNLTTDGVSRGGLSAIAIYSGIECAGSILFDLSTDPMRYHYHIVKSMNELSSLENTCCLEFCTAFSNGEELALDTFQKMFGDNNIPIVGGSSGSAPADKNSTIVSLDGVCYQNVCVFMLIHNLNGRIFIQKENVYKPFGQTFRVTDVDIDTRTIYEFEGKPAADFIAEKLNVPFEKLGDVVKNYPLGRLINGDVYCTEIGTIHPDGSISNFAKLYNQTKVSLLKVGDIKQEWEETARKIKETIPNPSFSFVVNCLSRSKLFERENLIYDFKDFLSKNLGVYAGLSGYGEQLTDIHLNLTMLLLMFE